MTTLYAFVLPLIILFCGLSIDIGRLELARIQVQSAADASVLTAVQEAQRGTGNWVSAAQTIASTNGFTNGTNATVDVTQRAASGPYAGRYDTLQTAISQNVKTFFMGPQHGGYRTVSALSVGLITPCAYLLGTGTLQSYSLLLYTGDWDANTCPVNINTSMQVQSAANMNVLAINVNGAAGSSNVVGETFPPTNYGVPTVADPLAAITSPAFSGTCNHTSYTLSSGSATLSPGTYCKGLNLTNSTVTLNAGTYVITGGATWSGSSVTGTGVTLFFTTGGGGSYGQFLIKSSSNVTLSAPTSGSLAAILVFADRSWTNTAAQDFQCNTSTYNSDGIWYIRNAGFSLTNCGNFTGTNYLGLVANNAYLSGTNFVTLNNYSSIAGGNPFQLLGYLVQ